METEEFEHYFRLCMVRQITSKEARQYLFAVNHHAEVEPDDEDVVMVYHQNNGDDVHCYDVRLARDVTAEEGDEIIHGLQKVFPMDDFECESSMENIEEQHYLMRAGLQKIKI